MSVPDSFITITLCILFNAGYSLIILSLSILLFYIYIAIIEDEDDAIQLVRDYQDTRFLAACVVLLRYYYDIDTQI